MQLPTFAAKAWSCYYGGDVRAALVMGRATVRRAVRMPEPRKHAKAATTGHVRVATTAPGLCHAAPVAGSVVDARAGVDRQHLHSRRDQRQADGQPDDRTQARRPAAIRIAHNGSPTSSL